MLADRGEAILDPSHFLGNPVYIHVGAHRANFLWIVLSLGRPTAHDRCDPLHLLIADQPTGDIDHHVAGSDHSYVLAHFKRAIAESREPIKVVHDILRVEHAIGRISFDADGFGALRADREDHGTRAEFADVLYREVFALPDCHIAEIMDIGLFEHLPVLFLQPTTQLKLRGENPIFSQPAEFDVPIQDNHLMAGLCQGAGDRHPCRSGADHNNYMRVRCAHAFFPR